MARASFIYDSCVQGYHEYKSIRDASVGETERNAVLCLLFPLLCRSHKIPYASFRVVSSSISSFTFLLADSISRTVKYLFACDLHGSSLLKYLKRAIMCLLLSNIPIM